MLIYENAKHALQTFHQELIKNPRLSKSQTFIFEAVYEIIAAKRDNVVSLTMTIAGKLVISLDIALEGVTERQDGTWYLNAEGTAELQNYCRHELAGCINAITGILKSKQKELVSAV